MSSPKHSSTPRLSSMTEAQRDLIGGSTPWFAQMIGETQWKRVIQVRYSKGTNQGKLLSTGKWVNIDGLSCLVGGSTPLTAAAPSAPESAAKASATAQPAKAAQEVDLRRAYRNGYDQGHRIGSKSVQVEANAHAAERVKQQHADSEEAVQILAKGGAEYRQQRDELLAALKAVLAAKQVGTILNHARAERDLYDAYKAARAAIAAAEGRAS